VVKIFGIKLEADLNDISIHLLHYTSMYIPFTFFLVFVTYIPSCRSQWPRGLRHEMSSLARTLGSWVRTPLKAWMFVCIYSVFSCVGSGLATG
jgi:hypothetical protein